MSLLVYYTLKDASHKNAQTAAMKGLVEGLRTERISELNYSCFATSEPTKFVGLLEFPNDATKQAFLRSDAFAQYRETVGPTLARSPETTEIVSIASTAKKGRSQESIGFVGEQKKP